MKKNQLLWTHILYWVYAIVVMEFLNKLAYQNRLIDFTKFFQPLAISNYIIFGSIFYTNYFFVLPRFLKKKKYLITIACWLILILLFVVIRFFVQEVLLLKYIGVCNYCISDKAVYFINNFIHGFNNLILAGTVIWFIDYWLKIEKQKLVLEQEKIIAERAFLQSQVNPHFLFNTLNNIYSMVFHNSSHSLKAIQKLSDIMRYSFTETASDWVALTVEVSYLKNYIELQKYRVKDPAVIYRETGDLSLIKIPPMLLISFVENSFKHGVLTDTGNPICIELNVTGKSLCFFVKNKINHNNKDAHSGVGLASVRKRLNLYYKDTHELIINKTDDFFSSNLILKIKNDTLHYS